MSKERISNATLLIIDVQKGFDNEIWGTRNNLDMEANLSRILEHWRGLGRAVVHVQHCSVEPNSPLRPGLPGCQFKDEVRPMDGEPVYQKIVNSAFIGTTLEEDLKKSGIRELIIVGLTTNHCISTTARMAGNLGFETFVVSDATATFDRIGPDGTHYSAEQIHEISLASLHNEFATVVDTDSVIAS
ncbi:MAG: cysteine hydrolase [Gammaproteobacteria bacterium]|nr:cysteine hydrolase [Gammaproteobacteria bacterium]